MHPTRTDRKSKGFLERVGVVALCISSGFIAVFCATNVEKRSPNELRPNQLFRAINAANGAQAGSVAMVAVKHKRSGPIVDVAIRSSDGRRYAVSVEGATGKVLSVAPCEDEIVETSGSPRTG